MEVGGRYLKIPCILKTLYLYVTVWLTKLFLSVVKNFTLEIIFLNCKHLKMHFIFLFWIFFIGHENFLEEWKWCWQDFLRDTIACYILYLLKVASRITSFIYFLSLGSQLYYYNYQSCLSFHNVLFILPRCSYISKESIV